MDSAIPRQAATVPTVAHAGAVMQLVAVRATNRPEPGPLTLTGLPDETAVTVRDRLSAAAANAGILWPRTTVMVHLYPADLPRGDAAMDAAIAVAVLAAAGHLAPPSPPRVVLAELGLDGALRPVQDLRARLDAAAEAGYTDIIVAAGDLAEAVTVPRLTVHAARDLAELVDGLTGRRNLRGPAAWPLPPAGPIHDLADIAPGHPARRVLEIAAAGRHHLLLTGPDPATMRMLAGLVPGLLPDLDATTAAEVARLHWRAGLLPDNAPVLRQPPWQAPPATATLPALTGTDRWPAAFALAHGGVLFFDNLDAFTRTAIKAVRDVLDHGQITIGAGHAATVYPTRVHLVATRHTTTHPSDDPQGASPRRSALTDRFALHAAVPPHTPTGDTAGETSAVVAARVAAARHTAAGRWSHWPWQSNGEATAEALRAATRQLPPETFAPLDDRVTAGTLTAHRARHVVRLSFTIADLAGHGIPTAGDVAEAPTVPPATTT